MLHNAGLIQFTVPNKTPAPSKIYYFNILYIFVTTTNNEKSQRCIILEQILNFLKVFNKNNLVN